MTPIHINRHKPVGSGVPFFALIDTSLVADALKFRWMTPGASKRPIRVFYDKEKGRPVTESLARWVWGQIAQRDLDPDFLIGHVDGDLLNCTSTNLTAIKARCLSRSGNTGKCIEKLQLDVCVYRARHGIPMAGEKVALGRPLPGTPEQWAQLRELRKTVGKEMTLEQFNTEIVAEELGKKVSWRGLKTIFSSS